MTKVEPTNDIRAARMAMLKEIFPDKISNISMAIVDMDVTLLSVADVLRNINRTFPQNTATRNAIANGTTAVAVLCKTELLKPLDGLMIVVTDDANQVQIKSKNYIVMGVSESTISSNDKIKDMLDRLTTYLIKNYGETEIPNFERFYTLFIYDAFEMEDDL